MHDQAAASDIVAAIRSDLGNLSRAAAPSVRAIRRQYSKALIDQSPESILAMAEAREGSPGGARPPGSEEQARDGPEDSEESRNGLTPAYFAFTCTARYTVFTVPPGNHAAAPAGTEDV